MVYHTETGSQEAGSYATCKQFAKSVNSNSLRSARNRQLASLRQSVSERAYSNSRF